VIFGKSQESWHRKFSPLERQASLTIRKPE